MRTIDRQQRHLFNGL